MANQQDSYTRGQGTGTNNRDFAYTFPTFTESEVKVEIDNVVKTLTTHYTIVNHNTTSGGTVRFNATGLPDNTASSTPVRIFRQTDVDSPKAEFQAGSSLKAAEINDNFKQVRHALQEAIGANATDRQVQSFNIEDSAITTAKIKDANVTTIKIADGSIVNAKLGANAVTEDKLANDAVRTNRILDDAVTAAKLADDAVVTANIVNSAVTGDKIAADAIIGSKIAADSINTVHYVAGSVDTTALGANAVTGAKIAPDAVNSQHYTDGSIDEQHIANSAVTASKIADNAVTNTEILNGAVTGDKIAADAVTGSKIAADSIDSVHYATGSVDTEAIDLNAVTRAKIAADAIDSTKLADDAVAREHIANDALNSEHYANLSINAAHLNNNSVTEPKIEALNVTTGKIANNAVTIDKIADAVIVTNSEQASHSVDDNTFFTTAAAEARYFNASSGETIKDGQAFPDNDTSIATTAAINDRIIDLVDDVGGFVPIANETSFPTSNPDINNPATGGTIVSVSAASTALAPQSGTTLTIANGRGTGNAVIITGVTATIPSGFGFLVETTSTDHTYAFHRLVPKATEVEAVAGKATEIGRLGTAAAVADMAILGTADVVADLAILGTADVVADLNTLGTADVVADLNTLGTADVVNDMNVLGTSANVTAMSTCATNISSINNASSNINSINNFGDTYQVNNGNPGTDGGGNALAAGDLYFDTGANELKVYNGSAWQGGVTATGNFAVTTGNTFTGNNTFTAHTTHNDNVKANFGTGSDLEVFHTGVIGQINNDTGSLYIQGAGGSERIYLRPQQLENSVEAIASGAVNLYYDNSKKLETAGHGINITGGFIQTGNSLVNDNGKIQFGDGADLKIYHNGTDNYIMPSNGKLIIDTGSETLAKFINNGAVELYHNNSKKFETSGTGATVTGNLDVTSGIDITGNQVVSGKVKIGTTTAGNTSADELVVEGSGIMGMTLRSDNNSTGKSNIHFSDGTSGTEHYAGLISYEHQYNRFRIGTNGGTLAVQINDDQSTQFLNNISVTGNITVSGTVDGVDIAALNTTVGNISTDVVNDSSPQLGGTLDTNGNVISFPDSTGLNNNRLKLGSNNDLQIYHDGTKSLINDAAGTGWLEINTNNLRVQNAAANETLFYVTENGSTQLMYDNSKKLETTSDGVNLQDGVKLQVGSHNDLEIYHSGNYSKLEDSSSAGLILRQDNDADIFIQTDADVRIGKIGSSEYYIYAKDDDTVELYYDNAKQLETRSNGIAITNNLFMNDTKPIYMGNGNDLQFYHDGSHSFIESATGHLYLRSHYTNSQNIYATLKEGGEFGAFKYGTSEWLFRGTVGGAFEAWYDGGKKFETRSDGVKLSQGHFYADDHSRIKLGDSSDLSIYHDGTYNRIESGGTTLLIRSNQIELGDNSGNPYLKGIDNGQTEIYYNASKKFETKSNGAITHGSSAIMELKTTASTGSNFLQFTDNGGNQKGYLGYGSSSNETLYLVQQESANISVYIGSATRWNWDTSGHFIPQTNNQVDIGSSSTRVRNIYTNDLNLSNEGSSNDVDGTWGNWTIQEGESDLFLKNNRSGKKYKFNLTEVS